MFSFRSSLGIFPMIALSAACSKDPGKDEVTKVNAPLDAVVAVPPANPDEKLRENALKILDESCSSCHSDVQRSGNFGLIKNVTAMIDSNYFIVAGKADDSAIIKRVVDKSMPPSAPLAQEKIDILKQWISKLPAAKKKVLSSEEVVSLVRGDLEKVNSRAERLGLRYFSLHARSGIDVDSVALETMRKGFAKVINSLSTAPRVIKPRAVDGDKVVYAVSLTDFGIDPAKFDAVVKKYNPFCQVPLDPQANQTFEVNHRFIKGELNTDCYVIRMDWFVATATLPKPYQDFMNHPANREQLDQRLGINLFENIKNKRVSRSGFKNSGVSSQNRIIERHTQGNGQPYWISYDFANNEGDENFFEKPLGPVGIGEDNLAFKHDGGEVIYQLPNGMFGYYLADAAGTSIDKGPTQIVQQNGAPEQFVSAIVNGQSCMSCHGGGLINREDQVRKFASAEAGRFSAEELAKINDLYVDKSVMKSAIERDNQSYFAALREIGIDPSSADPVNESYRLYNRRLTRDAVLAELSVNNELLTRILQLPPLSSLWLPLGESSGFVRRDEFQRGVNDLRGLPDIIRLLNVSRTEFLPPELGDYVVTNSCMAKNPVRMDDCFLRPNRVGKIIGGLLGK
ncbi:MAG: Serine/threonine-protein kinase pkn1 [Pseudomonadota bacterium]